MCLFVVSIFIQDCLENDDEANCNTGGPSGATCCKFDCPDFTFDNFVLIYGVSAILSAAYSKKDKRVFALFTLLLTI